MKLFLAYLRLVRPINLLIIAFTLYMMRLCIILPLWGFYHHDIGLNESTYALFTLSFLLMAAGGYIINDYYDIEIDIINKPQKLIIGHIILPSNALRAYWVISILGLITGSYSCLKAEVPGLSFIFLFYFAGLFIYSYVLKSTFLLGNIIVSICLGLVPLAGIYIQTQYIINHSGPVDPSEINMLCYFAWGVAFFAFLSSLTREIVKDIEDIEGDAKAGCKTLPVTIGIKASKSVVQLLSFVMIPLLGLYQYNYCHTPEMPFSSIYIALLIQLPILVVIIKVRTASLPKDFKGVSNWLKFIMFTGISYFFVFAYDIWYQQHLKIVDF
jgi:4-hydroxybenzoate polyprenyltransferase